MNLGFVDRSTVLHEFGHSLGLIHEHQSPFKGGFEWNREEVGMLGAETLGCEKLIHSNIIYSSIVVYTNQTLSFGNLMPSIAGVS